MLTKHNVYSAKVLLFSDSCKVFIDYFSFCCVFYAFRGQSGFAVGLSVSDIPPVLDSIPIASTPPRCYYGTQHQGLKPSLVPISIPCGD